VTKRPAGGYTLARHGFTESIGWDVNPNGPVATCTIQASAAQLDAPFMPAAMRTTLAAQANSGSNTITIRALPDAAVNPLQLSLFCGWQLTLDPGTGISETVTIAPFGIPATAAGYTTAVITLTSNLAHTHAANAVVCEALPAGVTDPTTYDWRAMPAPAVAQVLSAPAGNQAITIGPLADAVYNPVGMSLGPNWLCWLSPGTPQFETAVVTGSSVTAPGWQQATLQLLAPLAFSHTGAIICDPLPSGITNPAAVVGSAIPGW
jgi:hypothetical protein